MNAKIPENTVTQTDLVQWFNLKDQLGKLKSAEALLRTKIFKFYFTDPKEGTNKVPLNDGTGAELKATYPMYRTIDPGTLDALKEAQEAAWGEAAAAQRRADEFAQGTVPNIPRLPFADLIKYKPELVLSEYRKLTEEERLYFDQALIVKPGSPSMEISTPKTPQT